MLTTSDFDYALEERVAKARCRMESVMPKFDRATTEALADAWASIDGHLQAFRDGKGKPWDEQPGGRYDGYMADAESMLERLLARGFIVTPNGQAHLTEQREWSGEEAEAIERR